MAWRVEIFSVYNLLGPVDLLAWSSTRVVDSGTGDVGFRESREVEHGEAD